MHCRPFPSPSSVRRGRAPGFTLIELMVTVAIAGIMLALAAPALQRTLTARSVSSQASELLDGLHYARLEAVKRSAPVVICKTAGGNNPACSNTASWRYWMVFADNDNDGSFGAGDLPLRIQSSASSNAVIPIAPASAPTALRFQATGIMVSALASNVAIVLRPKLDITNPGYARDSRQVCVNTQGRATVVDGTVSCP